MRAKRLLFVLAALLVFAFAKADNSNDIKKKINSIKKNSQYLYAEATAPTEDEAYDIAEEMLYEEVNEWAATKKKLEALKRQQKAALSGVQEVSGRRENTEAAVQRAKAALEMAKLNLSYTVVVAPCDGKLGRRAIEEGQYIPAGQTITYIMPDSKKWIIANYKETQVENLHVGQDVAVTVDAISDREFKGKITAISGATGAKYSLVPTDNSAGNFVKIRQRIPVRIDFTDLSEEDNERLAAGMMAVVKAKL